MIDENEPNQYKSYKSSVDTDTGHNKSLPPLKQPLPKAVPPKPPRTPFRVTANTTQQKTAEERKQQEKINQQKAREKEAARQQKEKEKKDAEKQRIALAKKRQKQLLEQQLQEKAEIAKLELKKQYEQQQKLEEDRKKAIQRAQTPKRAQELPGMQPLTPQRIQLPHIKPLRGIVQTREDDAIIKEQRKNPQNHGAQLQIQKILEKHPEQKVEDKHLSVQDLLTEEEIAAVQEFFRKNQKRFKLPKETSFRIQLPNQEPKEFKFNYTIIQDYNGFLYLVSRGKRKTSDPSDLFYGLLSDEDSPTKVKKIIPINGGEFSAMKVERTDVKVTYKNQLLFEQEKQTIIEQKSKDITPATELIKVEHNTSQLQDEVTFIQKHFPDRPIRYLKTVTRGQLKNRMLCQEYTGKEVNELLQETDSTTEQLKIILAVLMALKEKFHDRDLVHGDFKPPNVIVENMIDGTYRVHIIDFGLSGKVNETPKYYNLSDYATPDQYCGAPFNPATDIYNFGEYIKLHLIGGISKHLPIKPDRPTKFDKKPNCRLSPKVQELINFIAPTQELLSEENPTIPTVDECIEKTSELLNSVQQTKEYKKQDNDSLTQQLLLHFIEPEGDRAKQKTLERSARIFTPNPRKFIDPKAEKSPLNRRAAKIIKHKYLSHKINELLFIPQPNKG